jgi:tetratricopeptide (TPR) repeat protein
MSQKARLCAIFTITMTLFVHGQMPSNLHHRPSEALAAEQTRASDDSRVTGTAFDSELERLLKEADEAANNGEGSKAVAKANEGLMLAEKSGNRMMVGRFLNCLGLAYRYQGQYEKALDCLERGMPIHNEIRDRYRGYCLNLMALVHRDLGLQQEAIELYRQAINFHKQIGNRWGECTSTCDMGWPYVRLGDHEKALKFFQEAVPICRESKNQRHEGFALNGIGWAYQRIGHYEKAPNYHQQALSIHRGMKHRSGEASALNSLGYAYNVLGQYEKAGPCAEGGA